MVKVQKVTELRAFTVDVFVASARIKKRIKAKKVRYDDRHGYCCHHLKQGLIIRDFCTRYHLHSVADQQRFDLYTKCTHRSVHKRIAAGLLRFPKRIRM